MAVQAQYPPNVLLNRNVQEGKDPLGNEPQPGGGSGGGGGGVFLDQSHMMIFGHGLEINPRKRGREVAAATTSSGINPCSFQLQPPQFINLSQIQTPQANVVSTGLRLAFGEQKHLSSQSLVLPVLFLSKDLAVQIKQQRDEMEQFLQSQEEQLRCTLADKIQRHYRALLGAADESVARRLKEKEAEVEKAARRNVELEARAAQLSAEAQVWQARARVQEAAAASLQEQLQQVIRGGTAAGGRGSGAQEKWGEEQGCSGRGEAEDAESAHIDPERVATMTRSGPVCKACRKRVASVVLLPCRHLCLCTECDVLLQYCPLCLAFRQSSVEISLF
ncbi:RING-type E3 ubiquitin transferase [Sarracenia purpurea var. burkii]